MSSSDWAVSTVQTCGGATAAGTASPTVNALGNSPAYPVGAVEVEVTSQSSAGVLFAATITALSSQVFGPGKTRINFGNAPLAANTAMGTPTITGTSGAGFNATVASGNHAVVVKLTFYKA